ncbi:hypothetical protein QVD17_07545 [Tagetes erecta]|uniref:Uncharacterized protein n=1 Tax=Tagetes erecta TaxID=13708 RepID=A0AAD8LNP1_TARER|nr:hypothetical protein QVD17_07545 [Tagetes erecta]
MASSFISTVIEESRVSPPPDTVADRLLPLTYFDFFWLSQPPIHYLFFYELPITQPHFIETIIPNLKHSLSITLQYFFPFASNLFVFHTSNKKPEITYAEGDSVTVTFAECNLDFHQLTGNHARDCDMFYNLIPVLGEVKRTSDTTIIPVFSVQVTLFPGSGISIGMSNHHCLGDASTRFYFLKAWTTIAQSGTDESFLANGTLPFYDRVINNPKLDANFLSFVKVESFNDYQLPKLCAPSDKVRATFIMSRSMLNRLKTLVSTQIPTLAYVSSFTIACAYIWSCIASTNDDELQGFSFTIDCRARMSPPVPTTYFGNCLGGCLATEQSTKLTGKDGFVNAAKLLGETLHKTLNDKDGIVKEIKIESFEDLFPDRIIPKTLIGVAGTPKLKFYNMDFGWGKPKKMETISIDYNGSISLNACKEKSEDFEIGVCLTNTKMVTFVNVFKDGLESYI